MKTHRPILRFPQLLPVGALAAGLLALLGAAGAAEPTRGARVVPAREIVTYPDGRPPARFRLEARDHGPVLKHGDGPEQCDYLGARDVWVFEQDGNYYMH